jgi:hypothetical protein
MRLRASYSLVGETVHSIVDETVYSYPSVPFFELS